MAARMARLATSGAGRAALVASHRAMGTGARRTTTTRAVGSSPNPFTFFGGFVGIGGAYFLAYTFRDEIRAAFDRAGLTKESKTTFKLGGETLTEAEAWALFRMIDASGDGQISKAELRKFFRNSDKYKHKPREAIEAVNTFYRLHDRDNSNSIDFGEFLEVLRQDEVHVTGSVLPEAEPRLRKLFKEFDVNGDGEVSIQEYEAFLEKMGRLIYVDPSVRATIAAETVDDNHDGQVDYTEFVTMWLKVAESSFKAFDKDGNGYLTADEVAKMLNRPSIDPLRSVVMRTFDKDHSGTLDYKEFFQYYTFEALQQYQARKAADNGTYVFGVRIF